MMRNILTNVYLSHQQNPEHPQSIRFNWKLLLYQILPCNYRQEHLANERISKSSNKYSHNSLHTHRKIQLNWTMLWKPKPFS